MTHELTTRKFNSARVVTIKPKLQSLQTNNYRLLWGTGAGKGTFIIERIADGCTTLRETGVLAGELYNKLKRLYNISGESFDNECRQWWVFSK